MTTQVVLALAVFGACAVEATEALTLVVAAGTTRGWRSAFEGAASALIVLAVLTGAVGVPLVHYVPIKVLRVIVGGLLLVLGLSWLRKAILRSAGQVPLHDEDAIYARTVAKLSDGAPNRHRRDGVGYVVAFKGVLLEGLEIVLIVISLGGSSHHLGLAAAMAGAAVVVVSVIGVLVARQLREVPENTLKFGVGIMLSSFGVFWVGEGVGLSWPGSDMMILALIAGFLAYSYALVRLMRGLLGGSQRPGHEVRVGET
jgi:Ca2+/H+ antiporter, TMEM165/GDT1 family